MVSLLGWAGNVPQFHITMNIYAEFVRFMYRIAHLSCKSNVIRDYAVFCISCRIIT